MTPHEILKKARGIITDEQMWTKGAPARDKFDLGVAAHDPAARCFCAVGAIGWACGPDVTGKEVEPILIALACAISRTRPSTIRGAEEIIVQFNDRATRTHAEVLAVFDRAIAETAP